MRTSLVVFLFVFFAFQSFAQNKEVSVISSGIHANNEEAKKLALRQALEMTIGTYITSTSSIENNKLLNDEIISLTRGLIKSYKVMSEIQLDNEWKVVVEAKVSLDNTISYIQEVSPQGTSVKISGGVYALNEMHRDFAKKNERKIIIQTLGEMHNLFEKSFDYKIRTSEPKGVGNITIDYQVDVYANSNMDIAANYFIDILNNISLDLSEVEQFKVQKIPFYTITFRHNKKLYLYFLRSEESIDVIRRVFNNFDYYTTRAKIQDGVKLYPLLPGSSGILFNFSTGKYEKRRQSFLDITNNKSFIYEMFNPFSEEFDVLPNDVYDYLKTAIEPNEWTGSRKINKKQKAEIVDLYLKSNVKDKNPDKLNSLIDKINQNPNVFVGVFNQSNFLHNNSIVLENSPRHMLLGPKGKRMSKRYLNEEYFPGFTPHLFLFSSGELVNTNSDKLNYSTDQLKKIDEISIHPVKETFLYKNGGIQINSNNKDSFFFSLGLSFDSYENLSKSKFIQDGWSVPEKRHFLILDQVIIRFPYFNLFPTVFEDQVTSRVRTNPEYRSYLSKTLEVYYETWDGKKEYGGPYLHKSKSGSKTDKYFVVWVKE
jgi:hypothetical protein